MIQKLLCALTILLYGCAALQAQSAYNKPLADSLGADKYGMCSYQFVILKTGAAKIENKTTTDSLFRGHMANIGRMAKAGKLIVAGPFAKNEKQYRGLYIFKLSDKASLDSLLIADPAIKAGLLAPEVYSWYGSAALPMYLPFHEQIEAEKH